MNITPEFLKKATELQKRQVMAESADKVLSEVAGIRLTLFFNNEVPEGENASEWPPTCARLEVETESENFAAVKAAYRAELAKEIAELEKGILALEVGE